ncbi:uncharacterized protein DUF385 [Pseudonocardia endophytica]|uniref:Uncharacterized protein DUF385 n=2 Tax=Pseudonocardia endophytica TaxID=401976 RepID=A0A4V2PI30_PSEEN|nr:uncharacterized protein DUF385 [Pseudonocardia endophytica]
MPARRDGTPPRWLRPTNRVLMTLKRLGVGSMKELPVLTLPGRRSGQPRRTPVSVLEFEGGRYLLCGYPTAEWPRNARANGNRGTLNVSGADEAIRLVELDEPDALEILRVWPVEIPHGAKVMKDAGVVDEVSPEAFEGLVGRCPVFRIEPDGAAGDGT